MFKLKRLTWVIGCALAVNGCSFLQKDRTVAGTEITPIVRIKHSNANPKIMYLLGRYHQGKRDYQRAIGAYEKALESNPNYVEALNGLGVVYAIQGKHEHSLEYFNRAIEIAPNETYLFNNLGYALLSQGDAFTARAVLEQALILDPKNEKAIQNLAIADQKIAASGNLHDPEIIKHAAESQQHAPVLPEAVASVAVVDKLKANDDADQASDVAIIDTQNSNPTDDSAVKVQQQAVSEAEITTEKHTATDNPLQLDHQTTKIEVSNGNGINGMARQVSEFFQNHGFPQVRLTNHPSFTQNETEIHYRADNIHAAQQINQILPKSAKLVESNQLRADIAVKILLGRDVSQEKHHFSSKSTMRLSQDSKSTATDALN